MTDDSCDTFTLGPVDTVPRCRGCGFSHVECVSQRRVEYLLHQLYGAVKNEVGVAEAIADVDRWLR